MTTTEDFYLAVTELIHQLEDLVEPSASEHMSIERRSDRLRRVALLALESSRRELGRMRKELQIPSEEMMWCPSVRLGDRLRSRRPQFVPVDPFAAPHRPRR